MKEIVAELASQASVEINVQDTPHLAAAAELLPPHATMYVSHLPKQTWEQTRAACRAVVKAGFEAIPHVPVRLIDGDVELDAVLDALASEGVRQILLIAGDYRVARGPFSTVAEVLATGALSRHGFSRASFAGHPEGHPQAPLAEIRRAEREKVASARRAGIDATLLTQFFFEADPFLQWAKQLRAADVNARVIAGLVGPAKASTLLKYALRCGVGPSMRALSARPESLWNLGAHSPDDVLHALAEARATNRALFDGVHFFCFGGFLRTCEWLRGVSKDRFGT